MSENWLDVLMAILATYRVSRAIVGESGPGRIFERIRLMVMKTALHKGINCPLCVSFWVSLLFAVLVGAGSPAELFILWMGIAGANVALFRRIE